MKFHILFFLGDAHLKKQLSSAFRPGRRSVCTKGKTMNIKVTKVAKNEYGYTVEQFFYKNVSRFFNDEECGLDTITIVFKQDKFDIDEQRATFLTRGLQIDIIETEQD